MSIVEINFDLAVLAIEAGANVRQTIKVLQNEWQLPKRKLRKANDDEERNTAAGSHGIPEIGRQEQAFHDALTSGQREAYTALRTMVQSLYDRHESWAGIDPWTIDATIDEWRAAAMHELATQPTKAYLLGQMLATDAINVGLARPLLPTDRRAIEFMDYHAFNEVSDAFDGLKSDLRTALIEGMRNGDNPREVARVFANTLSDYETTWDVIAITETARAESQGRLHELVDQDIAYCIGSSAHDARTCDDCLRLINDKVYPVEDLIYASNYGKKRADWIPCVPLHPRCRCVILPSVP